MLACTLIPLFIHLFIWSVHKTLRPINTHVHTPNYTNSHPFHPFIHPFSSHTHSFNYSHKCLTYMHSVIHMLIHRTHQCCYQPYKETTSSLYEQIRQPALFHWGGTSNPPVAISTYLPHGILFGSYKPKSKENLKVICIMSIQFLQCITGLTHLRLNKLRE